MLADQSIIPVWVFDDGRVTLPALMTGVVASGDVSRLDALDYETHHVSNSAEGSLARSVDELAIGLQGNGFTKAGIGPSGLFWLLFPALALGLLVLVQLLIYSGSMSLRLGRFGRGAATLRRTRHRLVALTLGLGDSRLNTLSMLDTATRSETCDTPHAADVDQRLFERALAVAWHMVDELASLPLSEKLGAEYARKVRKLEYLLSMLSVRDADVAQRAQVLLDATREAV